MKRWYAVYCKPQQDARAEEHLRNQSFDVFRPRVRIRRRFGGRFRPVIESMFPRYLFIRLDNTVEDWAPIRSTRGVAGLVRWGGYTPYVPDTVIDAIQIQSGNADTIDLAAEDYQPNERLRINSGPLSGYEGIFDSRSGEDRVIVLLDIMQQTQRLELPEQIIEVA